MEKETVDTKICINNTYFKTIHDFKKNLVEYFLTNGSEEKANSTPQLNII